MKQAKKSKNEKVEKKSFSFPPRKMESWAVEKLKPYARNARTHSDVQVAQIAASIAEFGFTNPILVDDAAGIVAGHGRLLAAQKLGLDKVPIIVLTGLSDAQRRAYIIADNKLALNAGWDFDVLAAELDVLRDADFDLSLLGFEPQELNDLIGTDRTAPPSIAEANAKLADRFMIPPFSVLNAREGWWQDRKRAWLALGIKSELGRGETSSTSARVAPDADATYRPIGGKKRGGGASPGGSPQPAADYKKRQRGDGAGRPING